MYVVGVPLGVDVGETDPQYLPLQEVMLQVTPPSEASFFTVAVNWVLACGCTLALAWDIETLVAGGLLPELPPQPTAITSTRSSPAKTVEARTLARASPHVISHFIVPPRDQLGLRRIVIQARS